MTERILAKCVDFDFGIEDHGFPYLHGHFDFEDFGSQGLGYSIDTAFLMRFLGVFGVDRLRQVNGRSCWVTHEGGLIVLIEPLHKKEGNPFDIKAWAEWIRKSGRAISAHELMTGEKP